MKIIKQIIERVKNFFSRDEETDEYMQLVIQRCLETGKPVIASVNEDGELEFEDD